MSPRRGQIWDGDLGDPIGQEQGYHRPLLVISGDRFSGTELVTVLPLTTAKRPYPTRIELDGLLDEVSYVQVEQIRTISIRRLTRQLATIGAVETAQIEEVLMLFLELPGAMR